MSDPVLNAMRDVIQEDVGGRGLRTDPTDNLITACAGDFAAACRSIAEHPEPRVCVVTGFFIPHGQPPAYETDGPLGALFLARALTALDIDVLLVAEEILDNAFQAGLNATGSDNPHLVRLSGHFEKYASTIVMLDNYLFQQRARWTHLIALERAGPSHTPNSVRSQPGAMPAAIEAFERSVPASEYDRCHSMRGRDITEYTGPMHWLFESASSVSPRVTTIGIGDGGNEIGMGKIPWDVIHRNVPRGGLVACRVPTDYLIVCGVSNWGAYALAAGVRLLRGAKPDKELFDVERERELLRIMVERGPLVDGVTGLPTVTVDGLDFERYVAPLRRLGELSEASGTDVRRLARSGELTGPTCGLALGQVQANLVVVPRDLAFDFLLFCQRNPKPCPLLDVTEPGSAEPRLVAPGADLRTDLPCYRVYRHGELVEEPTDLTKWWRDDLVGFLLGCSFTFENALLQASVPVRHVEACCNVPMYRTNRPCRPAGVFRGPMVVSMRPMTPAQAIKAVEVCARFPRAHGAPVHFGDPAALGVRDLDRPDFGDRVEVRPGEIPVFWACGVTPQAVAMEVRPPLLITHKPGHMFVTDLRDTDLEGEW